jgi:hypothetical protein
MGIMLIDTHNQSGLTNRWLLVGICTRMGLLELQGGGCEHVHRLTDSTITCPNPILAPLQECKHLLLIENFENNIGARTKHT